MIKKTHLSGGLLLRSSLLIGMFVSSVTFAYFAGVVRTASQPSVDTGYVQMTQVDPGDVAPPSSLVLGSDKAKTKLVVFSDFQCPGCRANWTVLLENVRHKRNSALYVRNLPLNMHEFSQAAAVATELARERGKYLQVATDLSSSEVGPKWVDACLKRANLNYNGITPAEMDRAKRAVASDVSYANRVGISATPTALIISDGKVLRLNNPDGAFELLE